MDHTNTAPGSPPGKLKPTTVAARDALMRYAQQWEHIASEGHVLLAQVAAYRHKARLPRLLKLGGIAVILLAMWLPDQVGKIVGWPVGKVAGWLQSSPKPPELSPAPQMKQIQPRIPMTLPDLSVVPSHDVIKSALEGARNNVLTGAEISGCDTQSKITDDWATADSFVPHCRWSADKTRLWIWGGMAVGDAYAPYMTLVRKLDNKTVIHNVRGAGQPVGNYPAVLTNLVPRALAADFPELKEGANQ